MLSRTSRSSSFLAIAVLGLALSQSVPADVTFSHDGGTVGVPPAPPNGVFAAPDVQDLFFSGTPVGSGGGPNTGNALLLDNPAAMGLQPGDNIDAVHLELRPLADEYDFSPIVLFSPNQTATGLAGSAVNNQSPLNSADLFSSFGNGTNQLSVNENQVGLAPLQDEDIDAFLVTLLSAGIPPNSGRLFFSLTPGSPTLAALGASPADILSTDLASPPMVSITARELGLLADDDIDGLVMIDGIDADNDGLFDSDDDKEPWVMFSVSPTSLGLPNSAVNSQNATDPPVGGDVYDSFTLGSNNLFYDDGVAGLGLTDADDVNGLDMPELALPGVAPLSGGPGGGPPGSGSGGCVGAVRVGVCANGPPKTPCKVTLSAAVSCNGGRVVSTPPSCFNVPCDDAHQAAAKIGQELSNLTMPPGLPGAGSTKLFQGGAAVRNAGNHSSITVGVNPNLPAGCKVVTVSNSYCPCITMPIALLPWQEPTTVTYQFDGKVDGGEFMFQQHPESKTLSIPLSGVSSAEATSELVSSKLASYGFETTRDGNTFQIHADPDGEPVSAIWATGAPGSGLDSVAVSMSTPFTVPCRHDLDRDGEIGERDLVLLEQQWGEVPDYPQTLSADFDQNGVVDGADLEQLRANFGQCSDKPEEH